MKFKDGYMISSGTPREVFVDEASRHVEMKGGIIGVKVKIMKPSDPEGKMGPKQRLPDDVEILEPKEYTVRVVEEPKPAAAAPAVAEPAAAAPATDKPRSFGGYSRQY
jgi:small subunit ribosomal protein S3e